MDIKGKTKDNLNAHWDLKSICNYPELELDEHRPNVMPKAAYNLLKEQKRRVCEWIKGLQFPNGYASNLARCVDMTELRMHGMKSHDCHVFMQKLILIAFQKMLPEHAWSALTEIFPPAFFDSMKHLNVHLLYEACVGGPVQYKWMYPFERFLCELKKKVKNKEHAKAFIVEAYIIKEIDLFTSQYFESGVQSKRTTLRRNDERTNNDHGIQVHPMLNCSENELLKSHYWGPSAEATSIPCYFVNGYNFQIERHNTDNSTMNCGVCVKSSSYTNEDNEFY
ncbi:UNVERIFIED_CONTAM: hypothetical protein Sradi_3805800 [Sesamum radiatum]|uniref:DUF4218 domain-containing protein n=1 Tax=Sesamum radiatum TaxID=300843 RepID=A0AAW2Q0A6_SESRA